MKTKKHSKNELKNREKIEGQSRGHCPGQKKDIVR